MELNELTYMINGCAMIVHRQLGTGFQEVIYQRSLAIELAKANIPHARETEQTIFYDGKNVGSRRADFIVNGQVVLEIKACITLEDVHLAQIKNYVNIYDLPIGLLINFGAKSLQFKKIFNPRYNPAPVAESGF